MERKAAGIMLTLLLIGTLTLAFNVQLVRASGTIYIRADGSIDPPTAPISTVDNVTYTFTDDINDSIVVERDNIVVDGAGYKVEGTGTGTGITLSGRSNVTVSNVEIKAFDPGIGLSSSLKNSISGNNITNNNHGILLESSSEGNTIFRNNIINNWIGISLFAHKNYISGNNVTNNGSFGVELSGNDNNVSGNNITNNGGTGVYLDGANDNNVSGNNITNGVSLRNSCSSNSVFGNNITGGVSLSNWSDNNIISDNNITKSWIGVGIGWFSEYNIVSGNNITNSEYGISLSSTLSNSVLNNSLRYNSYGIWFRESNLNNVCGNNITDSEYYGAYLYNSGGNTFYHNNFINNAEQALIQYTLSGVWDDGYPSGGNYWSDYAGVDEKTGPSQDQLGSDGIGDTPYVIDAYFRDRYPLMNPWPFPDVALTNVAPSKTIVGQGHSLNINVTVANHGYCTETFNVTAYYDYYNWTSGLVGYWKLNEGSDTTANDSSGCNNHGTLCNSPTWVDGKYEKALSFDGVDDYVNVPDSDSLDIGTDQMTIETWLYPTNTTWPRHNIFLSSGSYMLNLWGGFLQASIDTEAGGPWYWDGWAGPVPENTWSHIAFVYNGTRWKFYINGVLAQDIPPGGSQTGNILPFTDPLIIGARVGTDVFFAGKMDEVMIYNRALSQEEVRASMMQPHWKIESRTITLTSRDSTTITFTWNTTGFAKGNYIISAYATPVQGEIDKANNTFVDGTVKVTIVGDVDGDRDVDASDLSDLSIAYGSDPPKPNWNPNCDINDDNKVDVIDLFNLGKNYGKTYS